MALILKPKYSVSADGTTITVPDKTSRWSVLNLGGYDSTGSQNPKVIEVTTAIVKIAQRLSDGTFGTETTVNVYPALPSDIGGNTTITSILAGYGNALGDGIYRFTMVVQGIWTSNSSIPFLATDVQYVPLTPNACTCYQKASAEAVEEGCGCEDREKLRKIALYMNLLCCGIGCSDLASIQRIIDKLGDLCSDCDC